MFSLGGQGRAEGPAHCPLQGRRNIWEHWGFDGYIIIIPIRVAGANYVIECPYLIWKCSTGPFAAQSHPLAQGLFATTCVLNYVAVAVHWFTGYSSVPNRRVGPINPVGWIFHGKLINV